MTSYAECVILSEQGNLISYIGAFTMTKEEIYERMTIEFVNPDPEIPCEFDEGKPCWERYGKVCQARLRLSERTGISFEDRDVMEIVENMEEIAKICALKMFDYGAASVKEETGRG